MNIYDRDLELAVDRIRERAVPMPGPCRAIFSRKMGFRSGPQDHTFYACGYHKETLQRGDVDNFFDLKDEPVRDYDYNNETECDFCREE